jgi:molecular chaperone Hsp33
MPNATIAAAPDRLATTVTGDGAARVTALTLTHSVETARKAHETLPVATAALGRAMAGALLLAQGLKAPERLTLRLLGDGPLGGVVADASPEGDVRGYVKRPRVMLPPNAQGKLDVGGAVGHAGVLHVSHDTGADQPYTGSVPLVSGEIGEDLAHYLSTSLQIPSAVAVGVRVGSGGTVVGAGGLLVQRLPEGDADTLARVEAAIEAIAPLSSRVAEGMTARALVARLVEGIDHAPVRETPARWHCTCTRERTARLLASLGSEALDEMIDEDDGAELRCQFCGALYRFDGAELGRLRRAPQAADGPADRAPR